VGRFDARALLPLRPLPRPPPSQDIPEAKEPGLAHLCEFIEDCEFTYLSTQILHVLGESTDGGGG
jgi:hypothetical protein